MTRIATTKTAALMIAGALCFVMNAPGSGASPRELAADDVSAQTLRPNRTTPRAFGLMPVVLKSEWPEPTARLQRSPGGSIGVAARATPVVGLPFGSLGDVDDGTTAARAPKRGLTLGPVPSEPGVTVYTPPISGPDPMIAVGRRFMIASQSGSLIFLDKNGAALPSKNGVSATPSLSAIFADLVDRDSALDLNKYSGFPMACDSTEYPQTRTGRRYCIAEFYDLRAYFDPGDDRFVLLAHVRNALWTDLWGDAKRYQKEYGACGVYAMSGGKNMAVPDASHCGLTRRHAVFAVSKTADPRDGFHTYAITENNVQDWPWGAVNAIGNTFVVGHRGVEMAHGMAAMVFRLSDLRNGARSPAYFKLYAKDLNGRLNPAPIVHHGSTALSGLTLLIASGGGSSGDVLDVFGFPTPTGQGNKPRIVHTSQTLAGVDLPGWMARTVYRNARLYMAWEADDPADSHETHRVRMLRIPLIGSAKLLLLILRADAGYRSSWLGKTAPESFEVDDLHPAIAVNGAGDALVAFDRAGGEQVLYVKWRGRDATPSSEVVVRARQRPDFKVPLRVDYAWAAVDPVDGTFWFAHLAKKPDGAGETVLARVQP